MIKRYPIRRNENGTLLCKCGKRGVIFVCAGVDVNGRGVFRGVCRKHHPDIHRFPRHHRFPRLKEK